jgi:hypothetical protein
MGLFRELNLCIGPSTDVIYSVFLHIFFGHLVLLETRYILTDFHNLLGLVFPGPSGSRTSKMVLEALI